MMNKMMKKVAIAFAVATMAVVGTSAAFAADPVVAVSQALNYTVAPENGTYYVNNEEGLTVRALPTKESARIGGVYRGDQVNVTGRVYENGTADGWMQINFNGQTGYIRDHLSTTKPAPIQPSYNGATDDHGYKANANTATKKQYTVSVAPGTYLALRNAKSSADSAIVGQLQNGAKVTVIDGNGEFWTVSTANGSKGYVNSNYLV